MCPALHGCQNWTLKLRKRPVCLTFLNHDQDEANSLLLQPHESKINIGDKKTWIDIMNVIF